MIHDAAVVGNVLENDTLGGASITDPTQVTITLVDNGGLVGVSFAPNGEVTVPQGAPAGTYRVKYNLCMSQQSSVCDDAVVTIRKTSMPDCWPALSGSASPKWCLRAQPLSAAPWCPTL